MPRHWSDRVRVGDFSAIPVPFAWEQSAKFAHLLDGYDLTGSVEACFRIRERVLQEVQATGWSTASPIDLWIALFMEHRGCRHAGYQPNREQRVPLDQLCECLRVQLVTLGPKQRAGHGGHGRARRACASMTLTRDNPPLSELNQGRFLVKETASKRENEINFNFRDGDIVADLVLNSLAENTRRAYLADLEHFQSWGGHVPCDPRAVALYLATHAGKLAAATLTRRLAAITRAHDLLGYPSPARSRLVTGTLRGIRRRFGVKQREARPLLRDDLVRVLDAIGEGTKDLRDRALLLIGFAGGLRRSEIIALDLSDIAVVQHGLIIDLRRSKTDQERAGRKIGVPLGRTRHCPVAAFESWRKRGAIEGGPIFRPVDRYGQVACDRLSAEAVSVIVKERVRAIGFNEAEYSGHSLRAGFATSAAHAGVSPWRIRQQTGHTSDAMLARYIRDSELFNDNAADNLL